VGGRRFARAVERKGWVLLRVHGSHHIYGRQGDTARLSIPMHEGRDLKTGLLAHLMRIAGVSFDDL
jgi:predicted RNA binding protein YcfA (HicA-like mRNA interferase family)